MASDTRRGLVLGLSDSASGAQPLSPRYKRGLCSHCCPAATAHAEIHFRDNPCSKAERLPRQPAWFAAYVLRGFLVLQIKILNSARQLE